MSELELIQQCEIKLTELKDRLRKINSTNRDKTVIQTSIDNIKNQSKSDKYTLEVEVDGLDNYLLARKEYTINCCIKDNSQVIYCAVLIPEEEAVYSFIKDKGVFINDIQVDEIVSKKLSDCVVDVSIFSLYELRKTRGVYIDKLATMIKKHQSTDCLSYNLCHITSGKLDVCVTSEYQSCSEIALIIFKEAKGYWAKPLNNKSMSKAVVYVACASKEQYVEIVNKTLAVNMLG